MILPKGPSLSLQVLQMDNGCVENFDDRTRCGRSGDDCVECGFPVCARHADPCYEHACWLHGACRSTHFSRTGHALDSPTWKGDTVENLIHLVDGKSL